MPLNPDVEKITPEKEPPVLGTWEVKGSEFKGSPGAWRANQAAPSHRVRTCVPTGCNREGRLDSTEVDVL